MAVGCFEFVVLHHGVERDIHIRQTIPLSEPLLNQGDVQTLFFEFHPAFFKALFEKSDIEFNAMADQNSVESAKNCIRHVRKCWCFAQIVRADAVVFHGIDPVCRGLDRCVEGAADLNSHLSDWNGGDGDNFVFFRIQSGGFEIDGAECGFFDVHEATIAD